MRLGFQECSRRRQSLVLGQRSGLEWISGPLRDHKGAGRPACGTRRSWVAAGLAFYSDEVVVFRRATTILEVSPASAVHASRSWWTSSSSLAVKTMQSSSNMAPLAKDTSMVAGIMTPKNLAIDLLVI